MESYIRPSAVDRFSRGPEMSKLYHTADVQTSLLEMYKTENNKWMFILQNANFTRLEIPLSIPEFKALLRCLEIGFGQITTKDGYYIDVYYSIQDMVEVRAYHLYNLVNIRGWFSEEQIMEIYEEISEDT